MDAIQWTIFDIDMWMIWGKVENTAQPQAHPECMSESEEKNA